MLQLATNNPNFLIDNSEMNSLIESVRYGLKALLNSEEISSNTESLNNLLQVSLNTIIFMVFFFHGEI
jgi:hypothetical protein